MLISLVAYLVLFFSSVVRSQKTSYCTAFTATKTSSASAYYCTCHVTLCPGDSLYADSCSRCSGHQYFRLLDSDGSQVATSDSYTSSCAPCGEINNYKPSLTQCEDFTIREGCYQETACSGKVRVRVYNSTISNSTVNTAIRLGRDDVTSRILSAHGTSSSSSGYCNRDTGLTVGGIIAAVLVPLFCCGFCIALMYHLCNRPSSSSMKVLPTAEMAVLSNQYPGYASGQAVVVPAQQFQSYSPAQPNMYSTTQYSLPLAGQAGYPTAQSSNMFSTVQYSPSVGPQPATSTPIATPVY